MNKQQNNLKTLSENITSSLNAKASLRYAIQSDNSNNLYLTLLSNSNAGFFNSEPIKVDEVTAILEKTSPATVITSIRFTRLFKGSSSNSSGFLTAIIKDLKLILPIEGKKRSHKINPDYKSIITGLGNGEKKSTTKKKVSKKKAANK